MAMGRIIFLVTTLWQLLIFFATGSFVSLDDNNGEDSKASVHSNTEEENLLQLAEQKEPDRLVEYYKRNYTWPLSLQDYKPPVLGWQRLMEERFAQIQQMPSPLQRFEGLAQTVRAAMYVPNFTEYGWGLTKCSTELLQTLQQTIRQGLPTAVYEHAVPVIDSPQPPLFIDRPDVLQRALTELQPYAERWAGIPLTPYRAYGFRLYQNNSQLHMHVDKVQTHIISVVLHIDSSDDAEPWPIYVEDFQGRTNEIILSPGDILFYESSKCFHGRPKRFNGGWYSSLFLHYYPQQGWSERDHASEARFAIPPIWKTSPSKTTNTTAKSATVETGTPDLPSMNNTNTQRLQMMSTSLYEPDCPNNWCRTATALSWSWNQDNVHDAASTNMTLSSSSFKPENSTVWMDPNGQLHPLLWQQSAYTSL